MFKKAKNKLDKTGLRHKILWVFVLIWVLITVAFSVVAINGQINLEKNIAIQQSTQKLISFSNKWESTFKDIDLFAIRITWNDSIKRIVRESFFDESIDFRYKELLYAANSLYSSTDTAVNKSSATIVLITDTGKVYSNFYGTLSLIEDSELKQRFKKLAKHENPCYGYTLQYCSDKDLSGKGQTLVYSRNFHPDDSKKEVASIIILFSAVNVMEHFDKAIIPDGIWILSDNDKQVLLSNSDNLNGENICSYYGIEESLFKRMLGNIRSKKHRLILNYYYADNYRFVSYNEIPESKILGSIRGIVFTIVFTALCVLAMLIVFSNYLVKRFTLPLKKLENQMKQAEDGVMTASVNMHYDDEIGLIGNRFDSMMVKLRNNMEELKLAEEEKHQYEIKALQMQINPHFLYNTLSAIVWLSYNKDSDSAIDITTKLANYYRICLSDGRDIISIKEEIELAKNYVDIQQYRFIEKSAVTFSIDENILELRTPKLILQPLIENAYDYAIKGKDSNGIINVMVYRSLNRDCICYEVDDNGDEISEEEIGIMNEKLANRQSVGIGTNTVNSRVKLYYGEDYGLHYIRRDGITKAIVEIPEIKGDENESIDSG